MHQSNFENLDFDVSSATGLPPRDLPRDCYANSIGDPVSDSAMSVTNSFEIYTGACVASGAIFNKKMQAEALRLSSVSNLNRAINRSPLLQSVFHRVGDSKHTIQWCYQGSLDAIRDAYFEERNNQKRAGLCPNFTAINGGTLQF